LKNKQLINDVWYFFEMHIQEVFKESVKRELISIFEKHDIIYKDKE